MRVRSALRKVCPSCQIVRRGRKVLVICSANPRHKQRQGFSTLAAYQADAPSAAVAPFVALPAGLALGSRMMSAVLADAGVVVADDSEEL